MIYETVDMKYFFYFVKRDQAAPLRIYKLKNPGVLVRNIYSTKKEPQQPLNFASYAMARKIKRS